MPLVATRGAASAQGFGEFAQSAAPTYIEEVFSTYLYDGGTAQSINNGIDLATKGGLVWFKFRSGSATETNHELYDTARGTNNFLVTNSTAAQVNDPSSLNSFNINGFTMSIDPGMNASGSTYASWTFRKQPKFFDVVTWTGDGNATKTISHNLGSAPGCIMVKLTSGVNGWDVYHRSLGTSAYVQLNTTAASTTISNVWGTITSTTFTATGTLGQNDPGATYVAYLFAHDAGGFGLSGSDNVISCGSYTGNGSATGPVVTLGYEPQWVLVKNASTAGDNWLLFDTMRGMSFSNSAYLRPNTADAESTGTGWIIPQATGFQLGTTVSSINGSGQTYIYIAIRRGPMKTPTSGTSVFSPLLATSNLPVYNTGFPVDASLNLYRVGGSGYPQMVSRLLGAIRIATSSTAAQVSDANITFDFQNGWWKEPSLNSNWSSCSFRRAPGFFDVVCYTGTGVSGRAVTHNLGVVPELMIVKSRSGSGTLWTTYSAATGNTKAAYLNSDQGFATDTYWANTTPTSSIFTVGLNGDVNGSGSTYVAYLFASCPGVSKVGSVTHVEPTTVVCGFIPRFILIKSTTTTGTDDWFVFDSARGLVPGNDPYLRLNSTGAENTPFGAADLVDVTSNGFIMNGFNGGNYIYLAIA